jgi:cell division protein ZapA
VKRSVHVEIAGQPLTIATDEPPAYVERLAELVDSRIRQVGGNRAPYNLQRVALLVAMRLADELLREMDLHRRYRDGVQGKLDALRVALDEHAARLADG